jgi:sialate O-acetylesterase
MKKTYLILLFFWITLSLSLGNIRLPGLLSDNMVLQRDMQVPIWGWADPGESVSVELGGNIAETNAAADGKWKLFVGPLEAGGPFQLIIKGKNIITIQNVLVGEVWVCSGQSNMAMEVQESMNAKQVISSANYPNIRHFQVKRTKSLEPLSDVSPVENQKTNWLNTWEICNPSNVRHFTGVGYFFSLDLYKKLDVPIGIIHASWGGTTAEAWTPFETFKSDPELELIVAHWPDYNNDEDWLKAEYESYVKDVEKAHKQGVPAPVYFNRPSVLYNGIIAPVIPYGIRGVAWYQGESNAYRAYQYRLLLPAMITKWRENWGQGNFPFIIVQLANYYFEPQVFPELREAQSLSLKLTNTAMVVTIDLGDSANIHPTNKQEVGRRLFISASSMAYGEDILSSGPGFKSMYIKGENCFLSFSNIGDGLCSSDKKQLKGFSIAGTDRIFHEANACLESNKVKVWCSLVPDPVAVRYAWANYPRGCNLSNQQGSTPCLPASPFRTDNWSGITANRK